MAATGKLLSRDGKSGVTEGIDKYTKLGKIGKGTFGTVYSAKHNETGETVALKRVILHGEGSDGFPMTSLRELSALRRLSPHDNIVGLRGVVTGPKRDAVFLSLELCELNLADVIDSRSSVGFPEAIAKGLTLQLLQGLAHCHGCWTLHRDVKPSNLLLKHGVLKLADFGLTRRFGYPLRPYSPGVVTLWYRAPELLLGSDIYGTAVDIWAVGCIFAELLLGRPIFPGRADDTQLQEIAKIIGKPTPVTWSGLESLPLYADSVAHLRGAPPVNTLPSLFPGLSDNGKNLLAQLLTYDPAKRITAMEAIEHPYFTEHPLPADSRAIHAAVRQ